MELLFLGVESDNVENPSQFTLRLDRLDLNNLWGITGSNDDHRSENLFKLSRQFSEEIFEVKWDLQEIEGGYGSADWYVAYLIFKQNDGAGDYFMFALEDLAVTDTNPDIQSQWHELQHDDLVEILGFQWAMDTDFETAYYTD